MEAALEGIRVLDLANPSAILATRILADLGADVVMVEPPRGSAARHVHPRLPDGPESERSYRHLYNNANKRSVVLDVEAAPGRAIFEALLASADVLVETFSPKRAAETGFDDAALRALNPDLIHVSVTPFGIDAEWAEWRANDLVAGAASGLLWVCGDRRDAPIQGAANPAYTMASLVAATGVMLALTARDTQSDAGGCHLDIALQEACAMAALQTANASILEWTGRVPGRPGMSSALRCRDGGWLAFVPRPDRFEAFRKWTREAGTKTLLESEDWPWARIGAPGKNNPVTAATKELAEMYDSEAFMERAIAADMMCLPIADFPYIEAHPQFTENDQFFAVDHDALALELGFVRSPVDAMERDIGIRRAPLLGEHTREVLGEIAGASRLDALAAAGVIA